ncbi:MAG: glycosyl transferase [Nocardioides sp.]|nr:glycosyl transferase [Nocardioides sp.]
MSAGEQRESVALVVVTYNRADLLRGLLAGLERMDPAPDAVYVVDNASTDHTARVLAEATTPGLEVVRPAANLGGSGGFHLGVSVAHEAGHDRIWLMDDDVVPSPDCLGRLLAVPAQQAACLMPVREDSTGALCEKAATRFDLRNPLAIRPKTSMVETDFGTRDAMPPLVALENVAFEGFMVRRDVVEAIGLPDPRFFIFYDDVDYAVRARRAGFTIWAVRDAVLVRQLPFDQQHDLGGWKGYYMYRNLFVVHLRYGENLAVRLKPWLVALAVVVVALLRRDPGEARNVVRAVRDAPALRDLDPAAAPGAPPATADGAAGAPGPTPGP